MRKSGNKKKEISKSKRLMAVCLSMTFILGSMSYLAFADENEEEIPSDDPVIEEVTPAVEEIVAEESSDEEEAVAETTDTEEVVEETEEVAVEEEAVAEVETVKETEEVSVPVTHASVGTTYYVGGKTESSTSVYYTYSGRILPFRFSDKTVPEPTFSTRTNSWTFARLMRDGEDVSMSGTAANKPAGITVVSGSGTFLNPYVLNLVYHTHSFVLSAEDNVATVKCTAPVCYDYTTDKEYNVTLTASDTTYSGSAVEATLTTDTGFPTEIKVGDVKYVGIGDTAYEGTTTAPTDAGTYQASVTISLGESSATATVDFEIKKADPSVVEYPGYVGDTEQFLPQGSSIDLLTSAGSCEGGTLLYSLDNETYSETIPSVSEPGVYNVYLMVKGDKNHNDYNFGSSSSIYIVNYAFTEGADATWDKEADKDKTLTFTVKRSRLDEKTYGNVVDVYVDGEKLNDSSYNLEAGSAIVTLSADYLKTLADGKHSFKVEFSDPYSVETNFSITSPSSAPQTGEYAGTFVLVIGAVMAAAGAAFVIKAKKA